MVIIAMTLYLPQHIAFLTNRAWFYYNGDESAKSVVQFMVESATSSALVEKVQETVVAGRSTVMDAAKEL